MDMEIGHLRLDPGEYEPYDFEFDPQDSGEDYTLLTPLHAHGSITFGGNAFLLAGSLSARVQLLCSRCLTPVVQDLSFAFDEEFDEDEYPGDDAVMDLEDIAHQIWLTSIPMQVLCREDCKGLCSQCGKNLNEGACDCPAADIDPRMEIFRDWVSGQDSEK